MHPTTILGKDTGIVAQTVKNKKINIYPGLTEQCQKDRDTDDSLGRIKLVTATDKLIDILEMYKDNNTVLTQPDHLLIGKYAGELRYDYMGKFLLELGITKEIIPIISEMMRHSRKAMAKELEKIPEYNLT